MKLKLISFLLGFFILSSLFSAKSSFASAYQLSGKITDSSNTAISGATIDITNTSNNVTTSTTSDTSGNYSANINEGTYTIQVTPPARSII